MRVTTCVVHEPCGITMLTTHAVTILFRFYNVYIYMYIYIFFSPSQLLVRMVVLGSYWSMYLQKHSLPPLLKSSYLI